MFVLLVIDVIAPERNTEKESEAIEILLSRGIKKPSEEMVVGKPAAIVH